MNILSIQSHVAYGHVGNAAATFPLQRLGAEVWPVHTVQFSNHTGYGAWKGRVFDGAMIREIVAGIEARGVLPECDGVLSGYMGSAEIGEAVLDAVARVKGANPAARYCCDPVIGDADRGVFVREGIPEFMKTRAIAMADIVTPNHFELEYLAGRPARSFKDLRGAIDAVHALGPRAILATSVIVQQTPDDQLDIVVSDPSGMFLLRTPRLPVILNGAGDLTAALFFLHYMRSGSASEALSAAASSVFGVLAQTVEKGARELLLIEAQDQLIAPTIIFESHPLKD